MPLHLFKYSANVNNFYGVDISPYFGSRSWDIYDNVFICSGVKWKSQRLDITTYSYILMIKTWNSCHSQDKHT